MSSDQIEQLLSELRRELSSYDFFGFVVGNTHENDEISSLGLYPIGTHSPTHAAHSSGLPL